MAVAYNINKWLPGARRQGAGSADRPLCAFIAALASHLDRSQMYGELYGASDRDILAWISEELVHYNLRQSQALQWASDILRGACQPQWRPAPRSTPGAVDGVSLDPYQRAAVAAMAGSGGVLSVGCGLGKTLIATAYAVARVRDNASDTKCWIVCPLNAIPAWKSWAEYLQAFYSEVQVVSLDSLHKCTGVRNDGGLVIFDEVHYLGNMRANRTKLAHELRTKFDAGLCLTGTLLHGGVEKSLNALDLAIPGASLFSSIYSAGEYFGCLVKKTFGGHTRTGLQKPTGDALTKFHKYLSRHTIALTKESPIVRESVELPPQQIDTVFVDEPFSPIEDIIVEYATRYFDDVGEFPSMPHVAHALSRSGIESKLKFVDRWLDESGTEPLVLAANYTESLDALEQLLVSRNESYVRVDGSVVGKHRTECRDKFQSGKVRVFLGQAVASAVSMDLFQASTSILVDHSWRPDAYDQLLARTCRRGQKRDCQHFDLCANAMQKLVLNRVRAGKAFDASVEEWQRGRTVLITAQNQETLS